jgi:hypothetical protein
MGLTVKLVDANGRALEVDDEGQLPVVVHTHPPANELKIGLPFVADFTQVGGSSTDMIVDGSTTNVLFEVPANHEKDVFVKTVSVTIADASATLNKFANITALTNGVRFCWDSEELGSVTIRDNMKTNWDFIKLSRGNPAFGDGAGAFRAGNVNGTAEGYLFVLDMQQAFGSPWGIRLRAGSQDRLVFVIRDDLTSITDGEFTAECTGMRF